VHEYITGRLFTEDVREPDRNFLYSQTTTQGKEPRTSTIEVETSDPLGWLRHFYDQSEQRPGRAFKLPNDIYVLIAAQPDFDKEWFESLNIEQVSKITEDEETKALETRRFKFACGCSLEKIIPTLSAWKDRPDELFGDESKLVLQCPRCAKKYLINRDDLGNETEQKDQD
jgi:molecular chaperone Hsp33